MGIIPEFIIPKSVQEARTIQDALRLKLKLYNDFTKLDTIAGIDVGYDNKRGLAHASVIIMSLNDLKIIKEAQALVPVDFPYITGFLSFREIPAILAALHKLANMPDLLMPDLLMVDGQGIAHPRRMGIAAHLGVILDIPSIGVAKSRLVGSFEKLGENKGDTSPLMLGKEQIGTVLRSKNNTNPLFISTGHRVDMKTALTLTLQCLTRYRLPEPTRLADKLSKCNGKLQIFL